jgi:hypothetical protein
MIVTQLVKEVPTIYETKGSLPWSKSPPMEPILSQMSPVHTHTFYSCTIHFIIIFLSTPKSLKWSLSFRLTHFSSPPCHAHLITLDLINLIFGKENK